MYPRRKKQVVGEMKNADRYWQDRYFFMHVNNKSMGDLADAFYPLWGTLRKELKKPPPKALLFEEKLERLLALPDRDWDDIQVPRRLRASSLWKDFVELPSEPPSKPSSPPVKKRKVVEKPKRKVPAKRSKKSKVAFPETDVEGPRIEVDLPPRVSILQDRQTSVDIARQLFSDADVEIMKQGPP
ncbi:hypothetical protein TIFTF001_048085 [Ficus carica]|uniref:Uncharacterized protein n=1 Tax=Ficus carica TaxID=3494 RepID=A0AA88CVG8_FICCA|nr:hypothetical protein TIFTF001_048085 [Ficus carica]